MGQFRDAEKLKYSVNINNLVVGCAGSLARTGLKNRANRGTFHVFPPGFREFSDEILAECADKNSDIRVLKLIRGPLGVADNT